MEDCKSIFRVTLSQSNHLSVNIELNKYQKYAQIT